jgi:hypothetical protein
MLTTRNADDNAFIDQLTDDDDCDCDDEGAKRCDCDCGPSDAGSVTGSGCGSTPGTGGHKKPVRKRKIPLVLNVTNTVTSSNGGSTTGTSTGAGTGAGSTGGTHHGQAHSNSHGEQSDSFNHGHFDGYGKRPFYPHQMENPRHLIDGNTLIVDKNGRITVNIDNDTIKYKHGKLRTSGGTQDNPLTLNFPLVTLCCFHLVNKELRGRRYVAV